MGKHRLLIGCVADDFTGGSDIASFIAAKEIPTILLNGEDLSMPDLPGEGPLAVVVAMKTRSVPAEDAIRQTAQALDWLDLHHAEIVYQKYCSTFDSTPAGNIGPVADMMLERYDLPYTVLCPSLIPNGRTVKNGILYVNGVPLAESSMRSHPINPMWASSISDLMALQSRYPVYPISAAELSDEQAAARIIRELCDRHERFYLAPDYETDEQGDLICKTLPLKLYTGGSGLAGCLAARICPDKTAENSLFPPNQGKTILLSGSCSVATRKQIREYKKTGALCREIDPLQILSGEITPESVLEEVRHEKKPPLLFASAPKERDDPTERKKKADAMENFLGETGRLALKKGYTHFVCAGGETSGAVMSRLGYHSFWIGRSVAPGVPVMIPTERDELRLVLKSGNFGQREFFSEALRFVGV